MDKLLLKESDIRTVVREYSRVSNITIIHYFRKSVIATTAIQGFDIYQPHSFSVTVRIPTTGETIYDESNHNGNIDSKSFQGLVEKAPEIIKKINTYLCEYWNER